MKKILVCLFLCVGMTLLAGCGQEAEKAIPLTQEEITRANEAFVYSDAVVENGHTTVYPSEVSCFFTSYYSDPKEIDLEAFLRYCPINSVLEDSDVEEFQEAVKASDMGLVDPLPSQYVVPVHRYRKADVSALLEKYTGITVDDLSNTEGALYLEEYDAYYNFTSDFAPGYFECVGGEKTENGIRFWSAVDGEASRRVLTVRKEDGEYFIQSFLKESASD